MNEHEPNEVGGDNARHIMAHAATQKTSSHSIHPLMNNQHNTQNPHHDHLAAERCYKHECLSRHHLSLSHHHLILSQTRFNPSLIHQHLVSCRRHQALSHYHQMLSTNQLPLDYHSLRLNLYRLSMSLPHMSNHQQLSTRRLPHLMSLTPQRHTHMQSSIPPLMSSTSHHHPQLFKGRPQPTSFSPSPMSFKIQPQPLNLKSQPRPLLLKNNPRLLFMIPRPIKLNQLCKSPDNLSLSRRQHLMMSRQLLTLRGQKLCMSLDDLSLSRRQQLMMSRQLLTLRGQKLCMSPDDLSLSRRQQLMMSRQLLTLRGQKLCMSPDDLSLSRRQHLMMSRQLLTLSGQQLLMTPDNQSLYRLQLKLSRGHIASAHRLLLNPHLKYPSRHRNFSQHPHRTTLTDTEPHENDI
ncbi:uncharacterized protein LOC131943367 [Physella acuta]|uniref:uncharacterized protein LOC131943367 n=1 Tax=Physella acuta TaxID=109671 RepID=UPI0027DCD8F1|nr:uncharacterized protein LOC131943367 [Physella acuta]